MGRWREEGGRRHGESCKALQKEDEGNEGEGGWGLMETNLEERGVRYKQH